MLLALLAMAAGLTAGAGHRDETAAEQRVLGDMPDGEGTRMALFGGALRAGFHGFHGGSLLIYEIISDWPRNASRKTNANLPRDSFRCLKPTPTITYNGELWQLAELLPGIGTARRC